MAELREAGALGFSDDGLPIRSAGIMRRALQYQRLCGGTIALHEEDPDLSGAGVMHEGAVSAALGLAGVPSVSESTMIARDAALAGYEDGPHPRPAPLRGRVGRGGPRRARRRRRRSAARRPRTTSASPTRRSAASTPARFKMNPPLRAEADRQALIEGLRDGTIDCIATDHAPHASRGKGGPVRGRGDGRHRAGDRLRGDPHRARPAGHDRARPAGRAAGRRRRSLRARAADPGAGQRGERRPLRPRPAEWTVGEDGYESRSVNSWCAGQARSPAGS